MTSTSIIAMWATLAAIAAWGSYHFAIRDPRSTSWMKIAFAAVLLIVFGLAWGGTAWLPDLLGEGILAHAMGFLFFWPMTLIGAPLCLGSILGTVTGMYRSRDR